MSSTPAPSIQTLRVQPHDEGWACFVDRVPMPAWVVSSRRRAEAAARAAARDHRALVRVRDRKGELVAEHDFRPPS